MKLPESVKDIAMRVPYVSHSSLPQTTDSLIKAIVRDCTDAFIRLLGDSPQAKRAAIAVLHRYDLVAEPNTVAPQVSGNETGMPNGSTYSVPAPAAALCPIHGSQWCSCPVVKNQDVRYIVAPNPLSNADTAQAGTEPATKPEESPEPAVAASSTKTPQTQ